MPLNSMGELGTENLVFSMLKGNPKAADGELIEKSGLSRGTFYKYKKSPQRKSLI